MRKLKQKAIDCYAEYVGENLTAEMMLIDGCFILDLLFRNYLHENREEHDGDGAFDIQDKDTNCCFCNHEECVIAISNDTTKKGGPGDTNEEGGNGNSKEGGSTSDTKEGGGNGDPIKEGSPGDEIEEGGPADDTKEDPEERYYHILHVIHDQYLRFDPPKERGNHSSRNDFRLLTMPCATELDYAGVKFVAGTGEDLFKVEFGNKQSHCWWFHRAQFEIPQLTIDYTTEPFLRNLIAFEQCSPKVSSYFVSYAFLMGLLVNSEKDVQVLANAGIIHNYLATNQDAADLLNNLCQEVVLGKFHFAEKCQRAKDYSELCLPKNIAQVRRTYFASPWTFIAFCVGFIAFGIGLIQFILGFL